MAPIVCAAPSNVASTHLVVSPQQISEQIVATLSAWGMSAEQALGSAQIMLEADLNGIDSHGIAILIYYEGLFKNGAINPRPNIRIERETPATALIDADGALGHSVSIQAMDLACDKAEQLGVGMVTVRRSDHYGAAGCFVARAAARGMVSLALSNGFTRCVVPAGGSAPMFSTNPIAFGAPAKRNKPFMFDVATSTASIGKVNLAWLAGKPIPAGWVVGADGEPVTDAARARVIIYESGEGGLTPLGGSAEMSVHKGYGLNAMVEILAAVLPGAMPAPLQGMRPREGTRTNTGHCFMAISPAAFRDIDDFHRDMDDMMDTLRASRPFSPERPVMVPGDIEWRTHDVRMQEGVPLSRSLLEKIEALALRANSPYVLPDPGSA